MKNWVSYAGIGLALIGLIWQGATAWQNLSDRVLQLERTQEYLHGTIHVPERE